MQGLGGQQMETVWRMTREMESCKGEVNCSKKKKNRCWQLGQERPASEFPSAGGPAFN
jgi:hypothetical protein